MAQDLTGYRNSLLAQITNEEELQRRLREDTPSVNILNNGVTNQQQSVNILNNSIIDQQYNTEDMRVQSLNKEVETGLGTRLDKQLSDIEKKRYLNSLSQEQYDQMLQYKNEGYGFMASKALLENSHKLADPTATGLLKYKNYAEKDAYYNNTRDINPDSTLGKFATWLQKTFDNQTPTEYLANWWNTKYGEKVAQGDETYLDRFANMTFGTLVNLLDSGVSGAMGIQDKAASKLYAKLDRDILGLDTDNKFYREMDTNLASDISKYVGSALTMAALGKFTAKHPLGMLKFNVLGATKPGEKVIDLTIGNISRLANWALDNTPGVRAGYRKLDDQGKEALLNVATLGLLHGLGKYVSPKIMNTKVGNYVGEVRNAVRNSLEKGVKGAVTEGRIQAEVEKTAGTKTYDYVDPVTGEKGTFDTFEGYDRWYRSRIAQATARGFREGFWDGIYDEFRNVGGNKGKFNRGLDIYNPNLQNGEQGYNQVGGPQGDGNSGGGSDNVNGNNDNGGLRNIKRNVGESQLAIWNRMTKGTINKFFRDYGESYTKWLIDRGFTNSYETNIQPLINYAQKVQADKEAVLKTIPTRYVDYRVNDMLKEILKRAEYVKSPDLSKIQNLVLKNSQGGLTLLDTDWIRKWYGDHIKTGFHRENNSEEIERADNIYFRVQEFLEEKAAENGFDELKQLNKEIAAAYHIIIGATEWYNGIQANQYITLKDAVALAGAMSNPKTRPILAFRMMIKNAKVKDAVLKMLLKGRTPKEKKQIKIDFEKIIKTVEANKEAEAQKQFEEFMAKWNVDTQPIENALGYDPEVGEFIDYSTPTMVTPDGQSKRRGQIAELEPKTEIKRPGTTKPAEKIVDSVVNELVKEGVVEEEKADIVKENVMDNLSEKATEKLAEVEQKLETGEELMEEEQKIVEKVADTIENNKDELVIEREKKGPTQIQGWYPIEGENIKVSMRREPSTATQTQQDNFFGLKKQKGSSRINNFTNVLKRIIDRYDSQIDKDNNTLVINKEPYLPLEIDYFPNLKQIIVSHNNQGFDDPAIRFKVTEDGKLKAFGIKQAFMEQMGNNNRMPIKDTDELLHIRAVNLEDQFLDENTIDEDTEVMKPRVEQPVKESKPMNRDDSDITGRFRNLTLEDYKSMQELEGKERELGALLEEDNQANRLNMIYKNAFFDTIEKLKKGFVFPGGDIVTRPEGVEIDVQKLINSADYNTFKNDVQFYYRVQNKKTTKQDLKDYDYLLDEQDDEKAMFEKPEWNDENLIEGIKDILQMVLEEQGIGWNEVGESYNPLLTAFFDTYRDTIEKTDYNKQIDNELKQIKPLIDKYGEYRKPVEVKAQEVIGKTDTMNELQDKIKNIKTFDDFGKIFTKVEDPLNLSAMYGGGKEQYKDAYYYGKLGGKDIVIKWFAPHDRGTLNIGQGVEMSYGRPIMSELERSTDNPITLEQIKAKLLNADDETIKNMSGQNKNSDYYSDNLQPNTTTNEQVGGLSTEASEGIQGDNGQLSNSEEILGVSMNDTRASSETSDGGLRTTTDNVEELGTRPTTGGVATRGQQRLTNQNAKQILESHNFSTDPNDYTKEEISVLRNYQGAGGLTNKGEDTLGVLDQFYTPQVIVNKMWGLANKFKTGNIELALEPTVGTGRFLRDGIKFDAYEIDKFPGTIAQILNPNANVKIGDFQDLFMDFTGKRTKEYNGPKYDLVIGNPPYSHRDTPQRVLGDDKKIDRFEQYFIKKGIDVLKDNGILVMIVPSTFLRNGENYAKQEILKQATLVEAYRLPSGVFDNTDVGTDIIVFKKNREGSTAISNNERFIQHPEKVLGVEKERMNRFGGIEKYIEGDISELDRISTATEKILTPADIIEEEVEPIDTTEKEQRQIVRDSIKNAEGDKVTFIKKEIAAIPILVNELSKLPNQKDAIEAMNIQLDEYNKQLAKLEPQSPADKKAEAYEKKEVEVKEKPIATAKPKRKPVKRTKKDDTTIQQGTKDNLESKIVAIGDINEYDSKILDYLPKVNVDGYVEGVSPESDIDNLNYLHGNAQLNVLYFAGDIYEKLRILEDEKGQMSADLYNKQKKGLENAIPEEYTINDIVFDPNDKELLETETTLLKERQGWIKNELGESVWGTTTKKQTIGELFRDYIRDKVPRSSGLDKHEFDKYMNGQPMSKDSKADTKRITKEYLNKFMQEELDEETQNKIVDQYNKKLRAYVRPNYEGLPLVLRNISKTFRTLKDITDGNEGKPLVLSDGQIRGINFLLLKGAGMVAHGVGHGKTMEGVIATVEAMNKGWNKRPLFVVPGTTIQDNWMHTIKELYPDKEIVNLGGLTKPDRVRLTKALGPDPRNWIQDGQIAIISHDGLSNAIDFKTGTKDWIKADITDTMGEESDNTKKQEEKKNKVETMVEATTKASGKGYTYTVPDSFLAEKYKAMETETYDDFIENFIKDAMEQLKMTDKESLETQAKQLWSERPIFIEDLGIDHITVDEAHNFRNLFTSAKMAETGEFDKNGKPKKELNRFSNIQGSGKTSIQAKKLYFATQYILNRNNNRNVFLLTATPFNNHVTEIYNMLSYMARKRLTDLGIKNINSFYSKFANFVPELVVKPTGKIEEKEVMKSFANAEELQRIVTEFIDYLGDRPDLIKPRKKLVAPILVNSELGKNVQTYLEDLSMMDPKEVPGAMIKATTMMMNALISPYLVPAYFEEMGEFDAPTTTELIENSPKLKFSVDVIKKMQEKGRNDGVFIFMPRFNGLGGVNYHELFRDAISEYTGIPVEQIGIVSGEGNYKKNADITAKQFRDGDIRVLIGGDNTKEGIDLQTNGYITINLLQGWNPTDRIQLNGRVWRQGNFRNEVLEVVPMIMNSGDAFMQQKFDEKSARGNNLFEFAGGKVFDTEEMNHEEMKFNLLTDVEKKVKTYIDMEAAKIKKRSEMLGGDITTLQGLKEKKSLADQIPFYQERLEQARNTNNQAQITVYTDSLKKAMYAKKYLDEKLQQLQITADEIDKEIKNKEKEIELINESVAKLKEQEPEIRRQFEEESIIQLEGMKKTDDWLNIIGNYIDNLQLFSDKQELKKWLDENADEDLGMIQETYSPKKIEIKIDEVKVENIPIEGHTPALKVDEKENFDLDTGKDYSLLDLQIFAQTTDMNTIETIDNYIKKINKILEVNEGKEDSQKQGIHLKRDNGNYYMTVPHYRYGSKDMYQRDNYKYWNSITYDGIKRQLKNELDDQKRELKWRKGDDYVEEEIEEPVSKGTLNSSRTQFIATLKPDDFINDNMLYNEDLVNAVDEYADDLNVGGKNTLDKVKKMNKVIKEDQYKGTETKKELYDLKRVIKKGAIMRKNMKIKGNKKRYVKIKINQGDVTAERHILGDQYDELEKLGYIIPPEK